ncbi:hypothetical protein EON63_07740 [archaeon]|nr:MAG: hypothetical protein EON63_07740 [archaeon]
MSSLDRPWWDNEVYRAELIERAASTEWYVLDTHTKRAGRVIMICYNGYKVQFVSKAQVLNPNFLTEISAEEYVNIQNQEREHAEEQGRINSEIQQMKRYDIFFDLCRHERVVEEQTCRAAGCDIYDITCCRCKNIHAHTQSYITIPIPISRRQTTSKVLVHSL